MESTNPLLTNPLLIPTLENLIISGPLSTQDYIYNEFVKGKPDLEELEDGFGLHLFPESLSIAREFEELDQATMNKRVQKLLNMEKELKVYNRYSDILPYKSKHIVALPQITPDENTYINASYVSSSIRGDDKSFIVCQSPLQETIQDFWKMVANEGVHTIVMLCKFQAGARPQSCRYFPTEKGALFKDCSAVSVKEVIHRTDMELYERHLVLQLKDGTKREVVHYQWEGWPDHGVPEKTDALLYLVQQMRERRKLGNQPIVVHCSAGIGRSGTLVAVYNIAQILEYYIQSKIDAEKAKVSIFSTVRRLREQRYGMVQTMKQYELIYKIIHGLFKNPKLLFK